MRFKALLKYNYIFFLFFFFLNQLQMFTNLSAGAPGMPLPDDGTMTAFLSSVRVRRHSSSCDSRSTSSSDLSADSTEQKCDVNFGIARTQNCKSTVITKYQYLLWKKHSVAAGPNTPASE